VSDDKFKMKDVKGRRQKHVFLFCSLWPTLRWTYWKKEN